MATAGDYEEVDYAFIREQIFHPAWIPDPLPSESWRGIVQENSAIDPDPVPSFDTTAPTIYAAWKIDYDEVEGCYEGHGAPVRYGRLVVARFVQKGARKGPMRKLRDAILKQVEAAPDDPLGFDVQTARTVTVGYVGPWFVENLVIPFAGG
jgi:hypothetical protein